VRLPRRSPYLTTEANVSPCARALYCSHAFPVQELFSEALLHEIRSATTSASVYPTTAAVNALLLRVAAQAMKTTEDRAAQKLQQKLMLPVRKPEKGMALVVAYQYIKRGVGHLNSSITSVAIAAFVKHVNALKGMGTWSSPSSSSTRRVLKLSADECAELLRDGSFISHAYGWLAMLEAVAKVIEEIDGTATMITWSGPNKASRVIRCRYGHFANVSFRVRLFLFLPLLLLIVVGVILWRYRLDARLPSVGFFCQVRELLLCRLIQFLTLVFVLECLLPLLLLVLTGHNVGARPPPQPCRAAAGDCRCRRPESGTPFSVRA